MTGHKRNRIDHVLFCVADQWRADALGVLGTPGVRTPNLDSLVADSVLFANHWCQGSPCGPSRSSLLTGTRLPTHGQWTNEDLADHGLATLGAVARQAGLDPALIGYTDTPQRPSTTGGDNRYRGPDTASFIDPDFRVVLPFIWQLGFPAWTQALSDRGRSAPPDHPFGLYAPDGRPDHGGLAPAWYPAEDSDVALLTDAALLELERDRARSLLHVNWLRPHPPMTAPRPYHRLIDPDEVALPNRPLDLATQAAQHRYFDLTAPRRSMTEYVQERRRVDSISEADDRHIRAAYYGLVAEVDHHLGRLIASLKRTGRFDSTLIVIGSDHGDALGDHWLYGRRGPFDDHFRVPCIVRDPRSSADDSRGRIVEDFTENIDVLPTILDALELDEPESVEGRSLLPFLTNEHPVNARSYVRYDMDWADHLRPQRRAQEGLGLTDCRFSVVRTTDYRLVTFPTMAPMFFDLHNDPLEMTDRSAEAAYHSRMEELTPLALDWSGVA